MDNDLIHFFYHLVEDKEVVNRTAFTFVLSELDFEAVV